MEAILFITLQIIFENWIINMFVNNQFLKTGKYHSDMDYKWIIKTDVHLFACLKRTRFSSVPFQSISAWRPGISGFALNAFNT